MTTHTTPKIEMTKKLLIFDLDETLIHSTDNPSDITFDFKIGDECGNTVFFVYVRPYFREMIQALSPYYDFSVWTAGTDDYAQIVVQNLFNGEVKPLFVWSRQRCTPVMDEHNTWNRNPHHYIKDLKKIRRRGYDLSKILVIDNDARTAQRNMGNYIWIADFLGCDGQPNDRRLEWLTEYLLSVRETDNFRKLKKDDWYALSHKRLNEQEEREKQEKAD